MTTFREALTLHIGSLGVPPITLKETLAEYEQTFPASEAHLNFLDKEFIKEKHSLIMVRMAVIVLMIANRRLEVALVNILPN